MEFLNQQIFFQFHTICVQSLLQKLQKLGFGVPFIAFSDDFRVDEKFKNDGVNFAYMFCTGIALSAEFEVGLENFKVGF